MIDAADYNPNNQKKWRIQPEGDPDSLIQEAATQFAELFLAQCMYERKSQKRKTTDSETIC